MSLNTTRKVDVLLWGATGFAGQCAAEYLARNYPPGGPHGLSWALGGRNLSRLEAVREELAKISPACKDLLLVVGDSRKQSEVDAAVAQARVVMSTAGPFSEFGTPVVDACVRLGVHYCDITGESQWVRSLIQRYHEQARDSGVFIVPFCGFDSIPSDIGALMMARHMEQKYKRKCASVEYYVTRMRSGGGMAGGTLRSAFALMDQPRSEQRAGMHPYSLNPPDSPKPRVRSDFVLARYSSDLKAWYGTFVMSVVNTRVVRRSVALNSEQFTYQEYMTMGGFFKTLMTSLALSVMLVLTAVPLVRRFIERRLPEPGKGPDKERLKKAYFEGVYVARSDGGNPIVAYGRVRSEMDPGYYETGKMLSESAICLATQMKEILGAGKKGGVLTPASSMGELLLERLRKAKMVFEITDTPKTK